MQTAIIIAVVTIGNVICFLLGSKRLVPGTNAHNQRPDSGVRKILTLGHKKEPVAPDPMDVIMSNLENYDGTSFGQKDIPKG